MLAICNQSDESGHHTPLRRKRRSGSGVWLAITLLPLIAGCTALTTGPDRPITIEEDVANIRAIAAPDLTGFQLMTPTDRNQIVTARMYIADLEYHKYEAKLTRDLQTEGLAATLVSLGLTGSASVITVASTDRILAATATAITGADKAFSEKVLLSNAIQSLQTQMRADRKKVGADIYAQMLQRDGTPTPISLYTIAMALSDVDRYYQAGTVASALIGLSKTVAEKEDNSENAKSSVSPNPERLDQVKMIASPPPIAPRPIIARPPLITSPTTPIAPLPPLPDSNPTGLTQFERTSLFATDIEHLQAALCLTADGQQVVLGDLGPASSATRKAISAYLTSIKQPPTEKIDKRTWILLNRLIHSKPVCKQG